MLPMQPSHLLLLSLLLLLVDPLSCQLLLDQDLLDRLVQQLLTSPLLELELALPPPPHGLRLVLSPISTGGRGEAVT